MRTVDSTACRKVSQDLKGAETLQSPVENVVATGMDREYGPFFQSVWTTDQESAHVFCKWPNSKHFRLCGPRGLCPNYSALLL